MGRQRGVRAVVFDYGNVLVMVDRLAGCRALARHCPLDRRGDLRPHLGRRPGAGRRDRAHRLPRAVPAGQAAHRGEESWSYEEFREEFAEGFTPNPEGLEALRLAVTAAGGPSSCSNTSFLHARRLFLTEELATLPEGYVLSFKVGAMKPDPAIWRHLLATTGLAARDCLFIDDVPDYCRAAEALGFTAIDYRKGSTDLLQRWGTCYNYCVTGITGRSEASRRAGRRWTDRRKGVVMKKIALVLLLLCAGSLSMLGAQVRVVAYTAHEEDIIAGMVPLCKADTGMVLDFVKLGSGDVVKRVKAESANPQCDVIWSIGGEQLEANSDLLEKYIPKDWDKIDPVFKVGTNWLPYTGIMNVLVVNTELVPASRMPKGWMDLIPAVPDDEAAGCRSRPLHEQPDPALPTGATSS